MGWAEVMPRGTYLARSSVRSACVDACFSTLTGPLQQIPSATVDAHMAAVERLWPGRRPKVTLLSGGITNLNFKVEVDGAAYVLRMGGASTGLLGIDRSVEHAASLRAEEIGIGPAVVDFVPSEGWLVASFIDGHPIPVPEMRNPATLARVAEALRKLHSAAAIPGRFDAYAVVDEYRAEAESRGVEVPAEFAAAHAISERIRSARGPQPLVPCHNDLLNANFLDDGKIRIVDWEYAGMGDRFFDLANFSVNHEFGTAEDDALLTEYFGESTTARVESHAMMKFMSDFREAMWGV